MRRMPVPIVHPEEMSNSKTLCFSYPRTRLSLKNITSKLAGEVDSHSVGPTGAGKTTIVNLLTRLLRAVGRRNLDRRKNIKAYTRRSLRACFSVVAAGYLPVYRNKSPITYAIPSQGVGPIGTDVRRRDRPRARLSSAASASIRHVGLGQFHPDQGQRQLISI